MANPVTGAALIAFFVGLPIAAVVVPHVIKLFKVAELYPMPQPGGLNAAAGQALLSLYTKRTNHLHPVVRQLRLIILELGYFATIGLFAYVFFFQQPYPIPEGFYIISEYVGPYAIGLTLFCAALIATGIPGAVLSIAICTTLSMTNVMNCFIPMAAIILIGPYVYAVTMKTMDLPERQRAESSRWNRDWFRPEGRENPDRSRR